MHIVDVILGKTTGRKRSSEWRYVRRDYLKRNPTCACCGGDKKLEVHHIVPFHVAPALELEPDNLMTLCRMKKYGIHCHLFVGHKGNYQDVNTKSGVTAVQFNRYLNGHDLPDRIDYLDQ